MFATILLVVCIPQRIANSVTLGYLSRRVIEIGEDGKIRTCGAGASTVFKTVSINHSDTSSYSLARVPLWHQRAFSTPIILTHRAQSRPPELISRSTDKARGCLYITTSISIRRTPHSLSCVSAFSSWSRERESNPQPQHYKCRALTIAPSLQGVRTEKTISCTHEGQPSFDGLVRRGRLERPTTAL